MKNFKLPKSLVCLLIVSIVVAGFTIAPVLGASNHKDTNFAFTFPGNPGFQESTVWREKLNTTSAYMKCNVLNAVAPSVSYYSCVPEAMYYDQYRNYISQQRVTYKNTIYTFHEGDVYFIKNLAWENAPSNAMSTYLRLYAFTGYNYVNEANGVWSPDSV